MRLKLCMERPGITTFLLQCSNSLYSFETTHQTLTCPSIFSTVAEEKSVSLREIHGQRFAASANSRSKHYSIIVPCKVLNCFFPWFYLCLSISTSRGHKLPYVQQTSRHQIIPSLMILLHLFLI